MVEPSKHKTLSYFVASTTKKQKSRVGETQGASSRMPLWYALLSPCELADPHSSAGVICCLRDTLLHLLVHDFTPSTRLLDLRWDIV
jgi:hypothetical protein